MRIPWVHIDSETKKMISKEQGTTFVLLCSRIVKGIRNSDSRPGAAKSVPSQFSNLRLGIPPWIGVLSCLTGELCLAVKIVMEERSRVLVDRVKSRADRLNARANSVGRWFYG